MKKKEMKRISIIETLDTLRSEDLEGNIDDLIIKLENYKINFSNYKKIFIDIDYAYDSNDRDIVYIKRERLENDEEFNKRKDMIEKQLLAEKEQRKREKLAKEEKERKEFERLKAKFEK